MSRWHINLNDQVKGPFSDEQLKALCEAGVFNAASLASKSDYPVWKPLSETDFAFKALLFSQPPSNNHPGESLAPLNASTGNNSTWKQLARAIYSRYETFTGRLLRK